MNNRELLYRHGAAALAVFRKHVSQRGWYRIIRDPEGVVSVWDILNTQTKPFSVTFVERGRSSNDLERMSPEFIKAMLKCFSNQRD